MSRMLAHVTPGSILRHERRESWRKVASREGLIPRMSGQSVSHYHTPSKELTAYTHTLLWSSLSSVLTLYSGLLSSALRDSLHLPLSSLFWKVVVLQDGLLLLSLFTYLLVGAEVFVILDHEITPRPAPSATPA